MGTKKFFILLMIMFMLFAVSGCGGSGSNTQTFSNNPISPDKPAPTPETKSDDIPTVPVPEPYPQSQDKPISTEPIPTPTDPIISHDPIPVWYTVSFNSNGGSTVSSITVQSGHTISKPRNPKKYGCTFKGWYKDSALTQIFTFGADGDKVAANITLYAKWIEDSVLAEIAIEKVSIGYQDGDSASHVTRNITLPHNIDVSGDVANIIWSSNNEEVIYTNGTVTRQSTDVTVVLTALSSIGTADKSRVFTLKVIHAETPVPSSYTVSFNSNGGSSVSNITVPSGNTVTKPKDPSKNGYTFVGWYKDSTLTQTFKFGSGGDKVTRNITLYAKWIETDRLRAETAIGKVSIGYQEGDSASSVTKNLTLPTSVNASGDVNISWSSNNLSVISNSGTVTRPSKDDVIVVLTATVTVGSVSRTKNFTITVIHEATPESSGYTVSFDSNGGSLVASIHISSGGTVAMPENPTKTGYVFAGWYKDEAFTEMFTFGAEGDKITKDTTLYAQWLDEDLLIAEYSASEIVVGYANGDSSQHVTKNLTLPAKIYSSDISWISSSSAISSNGNVTRQNNDVDVTLTATAMYNGKSAEAKTFNIKVIRKRTRNNSSISPLSVKDASSGDIEVTRNDSGDVTDIEGMYVSFDIRNADDALDDVTVLRYELGIRSPDTELETFLVTSDIYSSEYAFSQVHKGAKVWGRKLVVSVNSASKGDFLHSSFLSSDIVAKADGKSDIGQAAAEEAAKNHYAEEVEADTERTEKVIYSLENYANNPVCAYIVRVYNVSADNQIDDTVFVNADTGEIIMQYPNTLNAMDNICNASGNDELGHSVSFDVMRKTTLGFIPTYVMSDPNLHVVMRSNMYLAVLGNKNVTVSGKLVESPTNTWTDGQEVSAYSNMREIMKWWKKRFGRDGLDDKGSTVNVIAHAWGGEDNAGWEHHAEAIYVYDKAEKSRFDHSYAIAADVLTHETTHGVLQYITGLLPYRDAIGAINEAYADILACVRDENWKMGERLFNNDNAHNLNCIRNIADPSSTQAMEKPSNEGLYGSISDIYQYYIDYAPDKSNDYNYVHKRSLKVSQLNF